MEDIAKSNKYPILNIGNKGGHTDYIDFLKWDEVTNPVMIGIDCYKRYFVVVKFFVNNKYKLMQTFFQRYTDGSGWMGCGHATTNLISTSGYMNEHQFQLIRDIINGKTVQLKEEHKPDYQVFYNHNDKHDYGQVELYDEKKWNAAIVIQKQWKLCRYNPKYKMCEIVQMRNLGDIMQDNPFEQLVN
jgi:hypothetical protein